MKTLFCLVLLLSSVQLINSLNILVYHSGAAQSHLTVLFNIIKTLGGAGHSVDLIVGRVNPRLKVKTEGARNLLIVDYPDKSEDSPWTKANHFNDPFQDTTSWNPFRNLLSYWMDTKEGFCPLVLVSKEVQSLLSSNTYDLGMTLGRDFCGVGLLHQYGVKPVVSYVAGVLFYFQVVHGGYPELPHYENMILEARPHVDRSLFLHRVVEVARSLHARWVHDRHAQRATELFRSRYGANFTDVRQLAREITFDLVNSNPILDEARPISSRIKFIGGLGLAKPKPVNEEFSRILDSSKKGAVLFSFGTQVPAQNVYPSVVKAFRDAFAAFPDYTFIWKHDGTTDMKAKNIYNVQWMPQTDLLYDKRVVAFVSHMGMNSFVEASYAGMPMICLPLFMDQFHNMRQAVRFGTGIKLDKTQLTTEAIVDALSQVLNNSTYKENARELASKLADNPEKPERTLLEAIEFTAKHKDLHKHFLLEGAKYNILAANGYDAVIFLFSSVVIASFVGVQLIRRLLSCLVSSSVKSHVD